MFKTNTESENWNDLPICTQKAEARIWTRTETEIRLYSLWVYSLFVFQGKREESQGRTVITKLLSKEHYCFHLKELINIAFAETLEKLSHASYLQNILEEGITFGFFFQRFGVIKL